MTDKNQRSAVGEQSGPRMTRRRSLSALAGLAFFDLFGDDDDDSSSLSSEESLGFWDTHWVADSGEKLTIDPEVIDFAENINVKETSEGVEISVPTETTSSETTETGLDSWTEHDDGTLEGPGFDVETATISQWSQGYDYMIFRDSNYIYVADRTGQVKYGGPDALGVSDPADFGEVLTVTINNATKIPSIRVSSGPTVDSFGTGYQVKTSGHTINKVFQVRGPGKNAANIGTVAGLSGDTVWTVDATENNDILRLDSLKFQAIDRNNRVDTYWDLTAANPVNEFISTHVEYRDAHSYGVNIDTPDAGYTEFSTSWFLNGAGLRVANAPDLRLIGNKVSAGTNLSLDACSEVVRRGNLLLGSVSTSGTTWHRSREEFGEVNVQGGQLVNFGKATVQGDNTPTSVLTMGPNESPAGGLVVVTGFKQGSSDGFSDLLNVGNLQAITNFQSDTRGTVGPRSYTQNGYDLDLAIDEAGETYDVRAQIVGGMF